MSTDTMTASPALEAAAHETLVASLRNAHALEKQTIAVLEGQLKLLPDYPDLHARIAEHIRETREQARRLESALEACDASTSMVKDALLSVMGLGQSSVQSFADDAVLKAVAADMMTEHLEIATYRMLLTLADMAGKPELRPRLEETLREEEAMAEWFDENLDEITRRFVEIKAAALKADATPKDDASTPDGDPPKTMWQTLESAKGSDAHPGSKAQTNPGTTADNSPTTSETTQRPQAQTTTPGSARSGD